MQRFTKTGIAILGSAMLLLSACNNNNAADDTDTNRSANVENVNNGYLIKQDRPYRTTTSSDKYPHTTSVQNTQGQQKYFRFINKKIVVGTPNGTNVVPNGYNQFTGGPNNAVPAPNNVAPAPNYPTGQTPPVEQNRQPATQQPATPAPAPATGGVSNFERQVIDLTNAQRKKNGLPALQMDTALSKVAKTKANDMQQKNYFSHTSPTYGSPFDMMRDFGVSYKTAGENIAKGQTSPEAVVNAWMNSEGHRKNILNANFTHIGVGHQASGNYWSQMFIGK
ncbi:CAP domain-containing protein [Fredinandcohnia sp. QZ13]|uniref:CAP domain-containing protein n=1 Tax=Fredinandcohnia sp. QZ13 TaxID=3073144 RepID=UPI002853312B|nr:CAP domain-containing protein [Fredinandcohnia sp. QZ13]MDR4888281.1 CAP domain-containing protein [Fredinandcohnia sp. QZ13]